MVKVLKSVVVLSMVVLVVGCSNNESPVAVNDAGSKNVASLDEIEIQDVSAVGLSNLWALTNEPVGGAGDYKLAKYNTQYGWWDVSQYDYGKMISVTPFGRCYHVNSSNQIWFTTGSSSGYVPNNTNITNIGDIAAAVTNNYEYLYIVGTTSNGTPLFWRAQLYGGSLISWTQMTGKTPSQISVDPWNYQTLAVVESGSVYSSTNGGGAWTRESVLNSIFPFCVAVSGDKIVAVVSNFQIEFQIKFTRGSTYFSYGADYPIHNVAADNANGYQYYYIDSNSHLQQRSF